MPIQHRIFLLRAALALALSSSIVAVAQQPASPPTRPAADNAGSSAQHTSSRDDKFVKEALVGGTFEVQAGQLALKNASAPEVRELAQRIVQDHKRAGEKLKAITRQSGDAKLDSEHQKRLDQLSKLSGNEFDRKYSEMMVAAHKKDIKAFEKEAERGSDAQVKQFAAETLPVLKDHLWMAQLASDAADREKTSAASSSAKTAADTSGSPDKRVDGKRRSDAPARWQPAIEPGAADPGPTAGES